VYDYVLLFKPFKVLTAVMCSALNECTESGCLTTLKEDLISNIDRRWANYENNSGYAMTTLVDSRHKDFAFNDEHAASDARHLVLTAMISYSMKKLAGAALEAVAYKVMKKTHHKNAKYI
jgi:hypothetical protein